MPSQVTAGDFPITYAIETTNVCNVNCSFCGYGKGADKRPKGFVDRKVFNHFVDLICKAGTKQTLSINTILGDPSASKDWLDLVREASSRPEIETVRAFSNGALLHRFGSAAILESGLKKLNLSTSLADPQRYKELYGVDQYDQMLENYRDLCRENKKRGYPVSITIMLRIDKPFEPFLQSDLYKEFVDLVGEKHVRTLDIYDDYSGLVTEKDIPKGCTLTKHRYADMIQPCYALFRTLQVLYDGTLQLCTCRMHPSLCSGNIMDFDSITAAWTHPGFQKLRQDWLEGKIPPYCKTCSHYQPVDVLEEKRQQENKSRLRAIGRKVIRLFCGK